MHKKLRPVPVKLKSYGLFFSVYPLFGGIKASTRIDGRNHNYANFFVTEEDDDSEFCFKAEICEIKNVHAADFETSLS